MEKLFSQGNIHGYLEQDQGAQNPFEAFDQMGTLVTWHRDYIFGGVDGAKEYGTPKDFLDEAKEKGHLYLSVFLYNHSGLTVSTTPFSCPWDSGPIGFIYVTLEKLKEEYGDHPASAKRAKACMEIEIKTLDEYLTGDVWGYIIQKETECEKCGQEETETLDSCCGFYGTEYAEGECKEMFEHHARKHIEVAG